MTDRERILTNIAAMLACELYHFQGLPEVRRYMANPHSLTRIICDGGWSRRPSEKPFKKGALVVCNTSTGRHDNNPFLISFVEQNGCKHDKDGLLLRMIGDTNTCDYLNENFIEIIGIPERMLWEGDQWAFNEKLQKALAKLDTYIHRFRGVKFVESGQADVYFGEMFGGLGKRTKPYSIRVSFDKKTTIKNIISQLKAGGFGTRQFEPDDGKDESPYGNPQPITRDSLIAGLTAEGIQLKPEILQEAK
jgi:hypothetical protein